MKVPLFGTCRLLSIKDHFDCNDFDQNVSYVHSTKEIIQLIKFLSQKFSIPHPANRYCFRTGIIEKKDILFDADFEEKFNNTDLFVVEISSLKNYLYKSYYLHHLSVDQRLDYYKNTPTEITQNTNIKYQEATELEEDIAEIQQLVYPKKLLIVSHINASIQTSKFGNRIGKISNNLVKVVNNLSSRYLEATYKPIASRAKLISLLSEITTQHGINFLDPSVLLQWHTQEEILMEEKFGAPPGHYTIFGQKKAGELFFKKIKLL